MESIYSLISNGWSQKIEFSPTTQTTRCTVATIYGSLLVRRSRFDCTGISMWSKSQQLAGEWLLYECSSCCQKPQPAKFSLLIPVLKSGELDLITSSDLTMQAKFVQLSSLRILRRNSRSKYEMTRLNFVYECRFQHRFWFGPNADSVLKNDGRFMLWFTNISNCRIIRFSAFENWCPTTALWCYWRAVFWDHHWAEHLTWTRCLSLANRAVHVALMAQADDIRW